MSESHYLITNHHLRHGHVTHMPHRLIVISRFLACVILFIIAYQVMLCCLSVGFRTVIFYLSSPFLLLLNSLLPRHNTLDCRPLRYLQPGRSCRSESRVYHYLIGKKIGKTPSSSCNNILNVYNHSAIRLGYPTHSAIVLHGES